MIRNGLLAAVCLAAGVVSQPALAVTPVVVQLQDPLDESRGWCVDLFAHLTNALPLGGLQGHTCFLYMGRGPTEDQGFDAERIRSNGEFRLIYFDMCMTLYDRNPGSFVPIEPCSEGAVQDFELTADGQIRPKSAPELCLTLGPTTVPGGGRIAPPRENILTNDNIPQIRRLTFETCDEQIGVRQRWQLVDKYELRPTTISRRFQ
jgi:Ricin-type beta-trefoil lectin domain